MARILVIEDNPVNMKLAALLLTSAGHTVRCAVDAETGLALARADPPDLVLMDFQLPGMDGSAATAVLKQDPATVAIPVIALTSMAMTPDQEASWLAGCDAHIAKPLRYRELYVAIDTLLDKRALCPRPEAGMQGTAASLPLCGATARAAVALPVDVSILESLVGKDPAVLHEFLDAFRISVAKIAPELRTACANRQATLAARQAHKLRSPAYTVGALALGGLCAEMETAGKEGRTEQLMALLPRFDRELEAVDAALDSLL